MARGGRDTAWLFNIGAEIYAVMNDQPTWRASCANLAEHLPPSQVGRPLSIVDLGCGPGMSAIAVARLRPEDRVVGLDIAYRMLLEARRRLKASKLLPNRVPFLRADAARLPFKTGAVDAVTGHSFLYLLPFREAALAEMRRVLRPGGRVVLMEPHARRPGLRSILAVTHDPRMLLSVTLWRPFSRLHGQFTARSLHDALEGAGFVGCQVEEALGGLGLLAWAEQPQPA